MQVLTNFKTTLSASATSSQSTISLSSIQTTDNTAHTITIADFTDGFGYMIIEPSSARIEIIKFTGITDNGDGSGILTGVTRGLAFYGGTDSSVAANCRAHQAGSTIVCSNIHFYYDRLVDKVSNETIAGVKTFSDLPLSGVGNPTSDNQFARKAYVDLIATGLSVSNDRIIVAGNAGETIIAGNLVYLNIADAQWYKCDADTASTVNNVLLGIAQGSGSVGGAITGGVLLSGLDSNQSGLNPGAIYYASGTAGAISSSTGATEVTIGIARSSSQLYFTPRVNQQITEDEQDALAGSSGTPSATNKFITADDVSNAGVTGKIVRLDATTYPAGSGVNIESTKIAGLYILNQSTGDILYKTTIGWTRLAKGTDGQVLKLASGLPSWVSAISYENGTATYDLSSGSGTQNIAHGLGLIPKKIKLSAFTPGSGASAGVYQAMCAYNGTHGSGIYMNEAGATHIVSSTTLLYISRGTGSDIQSAAVSVDATNIILTWTKAGSPTGTLYILWEAEG